METFRLGTRGSRLALAQAGWVAQRLQKLGISTQTVPILSSGDAPSATALYAMDCESPGLFTTELEAALMRDEIDLAVHSLKDLPTQQPAELEVVSIPEREATGDVLVVSRHARASGILPLKMGAVVGTSSLRREAQLYSMRLDLNVRPIRGNVVTRVEKVVNGEFAATVLARAGLNRLDFDSKEVDLFELPFVCAPGQGALAIETKKNGSGPLISALAQLNHAPTRTCVSIERRVLKGLDGGCTLPLGVRVVQTENGFKLHAFLGLKSSRPSAEGAEKWSGFEVFDISSTDGENLVSETVNHFRGFLSRS